MLRLLGLLPKSVTRVSVAADAGCAATTSTIAVAIDSMAAERAVRSLRTRGHPFRSGRGTATMVRLRVRAVNDYRNVSTPFEGGCDTTTHSGLIGVSLESWS